jgi:hypothetical protein
VGELVYVRGGTIIGTEGVAARGKLR